MRFGGTRQLKSVRSWMAHVVFSLLKRAVVMHSWAVVCKASEGQLPVRALHQMIPVRHSFNYADTQQFHQQYWVTERWPTIGQNQLHTEKQVFKTSSCSTLKYWNTSTLGHRMWIQHLGQWEGEGSKPRKNKQFVSLFVCCLVGLCFI